MLSSKFSSWIASLGQQVRKENNSVYDTRLGKLFDARAELTALHCQRAAKIFTICIYNTIIEMTNLNKNLKSIKIYKQKYGKMTDND